MNEKPVYYRVFYKGATMRYQPNHDLIFMGTTYILEPNQLRAVKILALLTIAVMCQRVISRREKSFTGAPTLKPIHQKSILKKTTIDKTKIDPQTILVDVIALSKKRCTTPIMAKLRFATDNNFTGTTITGYNLPDPRELCLLSRKAAEDLCHGQNYLNTLGLSLYIYDAYRPVQAVNHFWLWSQDATINEDPDRKRKHYPLIAKEKFFTLDYIVKNATYCYGNTLDVELFDIEKNRPVFMGARISYMGNLSHSMATEESIRQEWNALKDKNIFDDIKKQWKRCSGQEWNPDSEADYLSISTHNRKILSNAMQIFNFSPYAQEWWHYSHKDKEADVPMNLPISSRLKGLGVT